MWLALNSGMHIKNHMYLHCLYFLSYARATKPSLADIEWRSFHAGDVIISSTLFPQGSKFLQEYYKLDKYSYKLAVPGIPFLQHYVSHVLITSHKSL